MTITPLMLDANDRLNSEQRNLPHVLFVVDQFPKSLGGGERIVLKIASLLPEYGFRASILTFFVDPESTITQAAPCPIYLLPLQRTYDLAAIRSAFDLRRFLVEKKIKIVHTFFESSDIWAGFVTKTLSGAKLIWSRRDMGILRGRKHRIAYRLMSGMPDAVFAVSEQVRQYSIDVDHIASNRIQTIYNGLGISDWEIPERPFRPAGELLVTTVGNIRRIKGHDVFIRAAALVATRFPAVQFSIAGEILETDYYAELVGLIKKLNLSTQFRFIGGVTNLREHLAKADIFVLPSRSEGFSNAIIEAMAASLPVVATDVGGNAEAVQDGVSGFIVPSENPDALANAIAQLLSDPTQARAMGKAGRTLVVERFTVEVMMNQITGAYRKILSEI